MKRWFRYFGLLLGIVATVAFVFYAARTLKGQDLSQYMSMSAIAGIAIGALSYSLIIPISALAWQRLLTDIGVLRKWAELGIIMATTQLAKYIPGNVGQHIGRAAMSVSRGIPLRPYSVSVVSEMVLAVLAAAITGFAGCGLAGMGAGTWQKHSTVAMPFIAILACGFVFTITMGRRLAPRVLRRLASRENDGAVEVVLPENGTLAFAFVAYVFNYVVFGTGIMVMVMLLLPGRDAPWLLLTGCFALAWVIGFFAPGAPAGMGVREGLLLALLQFTYSQPDALLIVIALRLATTVGDILCFIAGAAALFISGRHSGPKHALTHPTCDHHET